MSVSSYACMYTYMYGCAVCGQKLNWSCGKIMYVCVNASLYACMYTWQNYVCMCECLFVCVYVYLAKLCMYV